MVLKAFSTTWSWDKIATKIAGLLGWNVSIHMASANNSTILSGSQRLIWHLLFLNYDSTIQICFQQKKKAYFIRKNQSYLREFRGLWQQELRAFITGWWVHLSGKLSPLIVATFSPCKPPSFSPGLARSGPKPNDLQIQDTNSRPKGFKFKFPEKIFCICSAWLGCPPLYRLAVIKLGVTYHESGDSSLWGCSYNKRNVLPQMVSTPDMTKIWHLITFP